MTKIKRTTLWSRIIIVDRKAAGPCVTKVGDEKFVCKVCVSQVTYVTATWQNLGKKNLRVFESVVAADFKLTWQESNVLA